MCRSTAAEGAGPIVDNLGRHEGFCQSRLRDPRDRRAGGRRGYGPAARRTDRRGPGDTDQVPRDDPAGAQARRHRPQPAWRRWRLCARAAGPEISLADVIRAVDGPLANVRGDRPENVTYKGAAERLTDVWIAVRASLRAVLESTSVADLATGELPEQRPALSADRENWVSLGPDPRRRRSLDADWLLRLRSRATGTGSCVRGGNVRASRARV